MSSAVSAPALARTREQLATGLTRLRGGPRRLGLVPTMGALHEGHLSLVDRSLELCDATAVSIFVNPLQFGAGEDLASYPRDLEGDVRRLGERGVDLVFAPSDAEVMYPAGEPSVRVDPGPMGEGLCGRFRPGHFQGVLTVVAKLFGMIRPDVAMFGRKDLQQSVLVRRMVEDLELGVEIVTTPVIREVDGLAMSSRNAYLSRAERREASGLFQALLAARASFADGEVSAEALIRTFTAVIDRHERLSLQYVELVEPDGLTPADPPTPDTVMAAAVFCGETRLIDNVVLGGAAPSGSVRPSDASVAPGPTEGR